MSTKKLQLLCVAILSCNLIQSPIQATTKNNKTLSDVNTPFFPSFVTPALGAAIVVYVGYNFLTRTEYLVKNRFPHAQTWYENLTAKYPAAHLDKKQFIVKPAFSHILSTIGDFAGQCGWTSTFDHIFFSEEALKEITYLYKKVIDGYPLDEKEQLALARQEFSLLHEAGHIEHQDSANIVATIIGLLAVTHGAEFIYNKIAKPVQDKIEALEPKNIFTHGAHEGFTIPSSVQMGLFVPSLIAVLRHQQSQADAFAREIADKNTLIGALTLYEDEGADLLYELENKKMTPFVATESQIGTVLQNVIDPIDYVTSYLVQQAFLVVKSMPVTRWIYDFTQDPTHEGPSIRAQKIKDELAAREN